MAKLALYKGKGKIGNALIRAWTRSEYSHCELVVGGICYSSSLMDGGVRCKYITLGPDHWDIIELTPKYDRAILTYYEKTRQYKYSWLDLIRSQMFNLAMDEEGAAFCSEWCAAAIGLPEPATFSPKTLAEFVKFLTNSIPQKS